MNVFIRVLLVLMVSASGCIVPAAADAPDQTVFITGANRGIGLEFARQYTRLGYNVIATCRSPGKAAELRELADSNDNLRIEALDLTDFDEMDSVVKRLNGQPIDILVNNAALLGDMQSQLFGSIDYEQFAQILAVNTIGTMRLSEALAPNVIAGNGKKIVTLGSAAGSIGSINGYPDLYAYRASKAALHLLMRNLSFELADEGVLVGLINPGLVDTRNFAGMLDGTIPTPPEFAQIVNLLKSGAVDLTTPETAVAQMISLIDSLEPAQSGLFLNADGTPVPW